MNSTAGSSSNSSFRPFTTMSDGQTARVILASVNIIRPCHILLNHHPKPQNSLDFGRWFGSAMLLSYVPTLTCSPVINLHRHVWVISMFATHRFINEVYPHMEVFGKMMIDRWMLWCSQDLQKIQEIDEKISQSISSKTYPVGIYPMKYPHATKTVMACQHAFAIVCDIHHTSTNNFKYITYVTIVFI